MKPRWLAGMRGQDGYTLIEVIIASAVGAIVMAGLTSVILTSVRATSTATSRVEASSQIRSFLAYAYDDFARSHIPAACPGGRASDCLVLNGFQASGGTNPSVRPYQVTYTWDGSSLLDRQVGSGPAEQIAADVTAFSWYIDNSTGKSTCVVTMTITVGSYSETQTHRFYPQLQ